LRHRRRIERAVALALPTQAQDAGKLAVQVDVQVKRFVAPDGSELVPATKPQPDGALLKALARAWRWQRMLDEGVYTTVTEICDAENISKSYVSQILRLALLAPNIVETILRGGRTTALMLEQLERPMPAIWEARE
jgi:hypothetical protein